MDNNTEILTVDIVEHQLTSPFDNATVPLIRMASFFTFGLILTTNVPLIAFILNQGSKTFLDWLIVFDCFICMCNTLPIIKFISCTIEYHKVYIGSSVLWSSICNCHVFFSLFTNICNRLITLGIAFYRFLLVLGSSFLWTSHQKKILEKIILLVIPLLSVQLTGWAVFYRKNWRIFLSITWILQDTSLKDNFKLKAVPKEFMIITTTPQIITNWRQI